MRVGFLLTLSLFTHFAGLCQPKFDVYYIAIGSAHYKHNPASNRYNNLPEAVSSARIMANCLSKFGNAKGFTFLSTEHDLFSKATLRSAFTRVWDTMLLDKPANPLLVIYYCGHGYSDDLADAEFLVPGDCPALQATESFESMRKKTIFVPEIGRLLHEFSQKTKARLRTPRYLFLLDCCRDSTDQRIEDIHLHFSQAEKTAIETYEHSGRRADPIVHAAGEKTQALITKFPTIRFWLPSMDGARDIGPLCRRTLLLLNNRMGKDESGLDLETFVSELVAAELDPDSRSQIPNTAYTTGRPANLLFLFAENPLYFTFSPPEIPARELLGTWTGTHYFGMRNQLTGTSFGGIGYIPLPYDSTHIVYSIQRIEGSRYYATLYEYFEPDSAHSKYLAAIEGTIRHGILECQKVYRISASLDKYSNWHWLDAERPIAELGRSATSYIMVGTTSSPGLYGGPFKIYKAAPAIARNSSKRRPPDPQQRWEEHPLYHTDPIDRASRHRPSQRHLPFHPDYVHMGPPKSNPKTDPILQEMLNRPPFKTDTLWVNASRLKLKFYDEGDVDGDSISVAINQTLRLQHQRLTLRPLELFLNLDSLHGHATIRMIAENEGDIPPNTAVLDFDDGPEKGELRLAATIRANQIIEIIQRKPQPK